MFGRGKKEKAADLLATGSRAVGTVLSVQDTGMTMNDNPRVEMTFRVEPLDAVAPFDAEKSTFVSRVRIPRPGERYPVWFDASDPSTWAIGTVDDDEGRAPIRQLFGDVAETFTGIGDGPADVAAAAAAPAADPLEPPEEARRAAHGGRPDGRGVPAKKAELLSRL